MNEILIVIIMPHTINPVVSIRNSYFLCGSQRGSTSLGWINSHDFEKTYPAINSTYYTVHTVPRLSLTHFFPPEASRINSDSEFTGSITMVAAAPVVHAIGLNVPAGCSGGLSMVSVSTSYNILAGGAVLEPHGGMPLWRRERDFCKHLPRHLFSADMSCQ